MLQKWGEADEMKQVRWSKWDEMMCKKDEECRWKISFYNEKKWGSWGAKPYEAARGGRKNVVSMRDNCSNNFVGRKWVNFYFWKNWFEYRRTNELNFDDTRSDAFADDENFSSDEDQLMISIVRVFI